MKKNIVRKHNDVIEACYTMNTPELRLIYSCISKIGFEQTISKDEPFYVSAMEYAGTFNVDPKNVCKEIRKAVNSIWNKELIIKRENRKDLRCRWLAAEAEYGTGGAEIYFSSQVIPYLTNLRENGNFTQYTIENISAFKSNYSIRLYEMLKKLQKISPQTLWMTDLRKRLCLDSRYKRMTDFKACVLNLATREINEKTDLQVSYKNIKKGRSIIGFSFTIEQARKSGGDNQGKRYLSKTEVIAKSRPGEDWKNLHKRLKKEGYTFQNPPTINRNN